MKKKRPILFPEFESLDLENHPTDDTFKTVEPGQSLKIGKPSSNYFQHLYTSLNFGNHTIEGFKGMLDIQGLDVSVASILTLNNGSIYAALLRKDEKEFLENTSKIYAEIEKSINTKELIAS